MSVLERIVIRNGNCDTIGVIDGVVQIENLPGLKASSSAMRVAPPLITLLARVYFCLWAYEWSYSIRYDAVRSSAVGFGADERAKDKIK